MFKHEILEILVLTNCYEERTFSCIFTIYIFGQVGSLITELMGHTGLTCLNKYIKYNARITS